MTVAPARRVALAVLARVRRDQAFSGPVLAGELADAHLSPQDSGLVTRLVSGVLSTSGVLDEALGRYLRQKPEPRVADVLRLAAYELLYGRAPSYAVVDQAVVAVRRVRPQAAGMANAVLRRLADDAASFPWGDPAHDRDALARATGHPRWIVDLAIDALGQSHAGDMLQSGLEPAPSYVRLDPFAGDRDRTIAGLAPAEPMPAPPDEDCLRLGAPAHAYSASEDGPRAWFAMDAAAQMAPALCRPQDGERICDLGAGRGNKTVCLQAIAVRSGGPASITAADLHAHKLRGLRERLETSGVPGVTTVAADIVDLAADAAFRMSFDTVLLDAPCTGLGTLRRYPEKRWRIGSDDVERMATVQDVLLNAASELVRPGGRLVYSTCSVAPSENGGTVERFCSTEAGSHFSRSRVDDQVPREWEMFVDADGCFQSWPTVGGPDGHFVAVLHREESAAGPK